MTVTTPTPVQALTVPAESSAGRVPSGVLLLTFLTFVGLCYFPMLLQTGRTVIFSDDMAYGFFAPNVPENYKLAFEFRNRDGSVEYDLPSVDSGAAELRVGSLLDAIGRSDSEKYRRILIRMLTAAVWENHPEAISVHAVFGKLKLPSPLEFERGVAPSYEFIAAYDFERSADSNPK